VCNGCRWRHAQVGPGNTAVLERGIQEVARKYAMDWRVSFATKQKRMALLVRCVGGV
jgi:formyltetrahydrofolate hydrolase